MGLQPSPCKDSSSCLSLLDRSAERSTDFTHLERSLPLHAGTFFATDSPPSAPRFQGPPEFFHHLCLTQVLTRALSSRLISLLDVFSLVSLPHSTTIITKYRPSLSPQPRVMLQAAHRCLQHKCSVHFAPLPSTPTCPPASPPHTAWSCLSSHQQGEHCAHTTGSPLSPMGPQDKAMNTAVPIQFSSVSGCIFVPVRLAHICRLFLKCDDNVYLLCFNLMVTLTFRLQSVCFCFTYCIGGHSFLCCSLCLPVSLSLSLSLSLSHTHTHTHTHTHSSPHYCPLRSQSKMLNLPQATVP